MEQAQKSDTKLEVNTEDIKYVAIEAINKDDKEASAVIAGLFKGIKVRKNETTSTDETFFMIHDDKDSTFVLNDEFHNIIPRCISLMRQEPCPLLTLTACVRHN